MQLEDLGREHKDVIKQKTLSLSSAMQTLVTRCLIAMTRQNSPRGCLWSCDFKAERISEALYTAGYEVLPLEPCCHRRHRKYPTFNKPEEAGEDYKTVEAKPLRS